MKSKIQWFHVFKIDGTFELQQQLHYIIADCQKLPKFASTSAGVHIYFVDGILNVDSTWLTV